MNTDRIFTLGLWIRKRPRSPTLEICALVQEPSLLLLGGRRTKMTLPL